MTMRWRARKPSRSGQSIARAMGTLAIHTLDSIMGGVSPHRDGEASGILIVFPHAMGDFVLLTALLSGIMELGEPVTVLCQDQVASLAELLGGRIEVIRFNRRQFQRDLRHRYSVRRLIRRQRYKIACYASFSRIEVGDTLVRFALADEKIGFLGDLNNMTARARNRGNQWYSRLLVEDGEDSREIDHYRAFARGLGVSDPEALSPHLPTCEEGRAEILARLNRSGCSLPYAVVHAGAASDLRIWPARNWSAVCEALSRNGVTPVLVGGGGERALSRTIATAAGGLVIDLTGETSASELVHLIDNARIFVGSESGPLQVALAVRTPSVCVMGGGHPFRFSPRGMGRHLTAWKPMACFGCNWECIYETTRCVQEIPLADVLMHVQTLIHRVATETP